MPELMIAVAITGGTLLGIIRVTQQLSKMGNINQDRQLLQMDSNIFLTRLALNIKKAGDGLQGNSVPASGQTLVALPDNPMNNTNPRIIFLSKDNPPVGTMGSEDFWMVYSTATQDGKSGILEQVHKGSDWLSIRAGTGSVVQSNFLGAQSGVVVSTLSFTLYDGQLPAQIANQSPQATSAVRIAVHLKTKRTGVTREQTVNLDNLIYGPH
jgi:hypothetical protein